MAGVKTAGLRDSTEDARVERQADAELADEKERRGTSPTVPLRKAEGG